MFLPIQSGELNSMLNKYGTIYINVLLILFFFRNQLRCPNGFYFRKFLLEHSGIAVTACYDGSDAESETLEMNISPHVYIIIVVV